MLYCSAILPFKTKLRSHAEANMLCPRRAEDEQHTAQKQRMAEGEKRCRGQDKPAYFTLLSVHLNIGAGR
jgi:hypothetical protein